MLKLLDFENPENNNFTAVSQMWIKGTFGYCRPDVLIFVNGLPLVFIELKNENEFRLKTKSNRCRILKIVHSLYGSKSFIL